MSEQNKVSPKILKATFIFIIVFFLLVILFNFWIVASLKDAGETKVTTTTVITKPEMQKPPQAKESKIIKQETKEVEIEYDTSPGAKGQLLLE